MLVEKERTVPDTYPLSLNALVAGCNQKTSREPVLSAGDAEVQAALDHLLSLTLVIESSGGRVPRFAHNVGKVLAIPPQSVALLAVLFLRGPQTPGEIRINSERLHRFGDTMAVEAFLRELAERPAGALVAELPRAPGTRETRWGHLLGDGPQPSVSPAARDDSDSLAPASHDELERLRADIDALKATVARLCAAVGIEP